MRRIFSTEITLDGFVICVGNATAGGTGKTQIIKWLARYCTEKNLNFVIISKGFGSLNTKATIVDSNKHTAIDVGDEALEMCEFGKVISAKDITQTIPLIKQIKSDSFSKKRFSSDKFIILVDDGMQNPNFYKDMIIMTVDANRGFGNGRIIPAGPLREDPLNAISRSDIIITIGKEKAKSRESSKGERESKDTERVDILSSFVNPILNQNILSLQANIEFKSPQNFTKGKYIAFCGIGNPESFFTMLEEQAIQIIEKIPFADHHNYEASELDNLCIMARKKGARLITTKKDFMRLHSIVGEDNIHMIDSIEAVVNFDPSTEQFEDLLNQRIEKFDNLVA